MVLVSQSVLEESCHYCPGLIDGYNTNDIWANCETNKGDISNGKQIGCNFLCKMNDASESMMVNRAKSNDGKYKNVLCK